MTLSCKAGTALKLGSLEIHHEKPALKGAIRREKQLKCCRKGGCSSRAGTGGGIGCCSPGNAPALGNAPLRCVEALEILYVCLYKYKSQWF